VPYGFVGDQVGLWRDGGARATDLRGRAFCRTAAMSSYSPQSAAARVVRRDESTDDTPMCGPRKTCSAAYTRGSRGCQLIRRCDAAAQPQRRAPHRRVLDSPVTTGLNGTGSRQRLGC
jgi:hypothetical protein